MSSAKKFVPWGRPDKYAGFECGGRNGGTLIRLIAGREKFRKDSEISNFSFFCALFVLFKTVRKKRHGDSFRHCFQKLYGGSQQKSG